MGTAADMRLDSLVGDIYEAVTSPTGFQQFIENLKRDYELKAAMIVTRHLETGELKGLWAVALDRSWQEKYVLEYGKEDMLAIHMASAPIAAFYASNLDLPTDHFQGSRFYHEWVKPQGVACASGAIVLREGPWLSQMVLQRSPRHPAFSRADLDLFNRLLPHLQRAIQMRQRFAELEFGRREFTYGLDLIAMPSILIDEFGKVVYANEGAGRLMASRRSLWLEDDHLRTAHSRVTHQINNEIMSAARAGRGDTVDAPNVVLVPRIGGRPLMLLISPMRLPEAAGLRGGALLFAYDPDRVPRATAQVIGKLFELTDAEADLAVLLCAGKTLEEAAAERGTTIHTTRSQLKSIFGKTGTNRQTDLISVMLSSPAFFTAPPAPPG